MKKSLFFSQKKPLTVLVLGAFILILALWFVVKGFGSSSQIIGMGLLAVGLLGYSVSYEIAADFKNKRHFKILGLSIFRSNLNSTYPDYIVVFSAKFKQAADWGSVAAMGRERSGDSWVIRLFKGNRHFTVYQTKSLEEATRRATELSELLGVEIRGKK